MPSWSFWRQSWSHLWNCATSSSIATSARARSSARPGSRRFEIYTSPAWYREVWAGRARFPRSLRIVLLGQCGRVLRIALPNVFTGPRCAGGPGCCPCVVPDQPGRLYSGVGGAVSIAAEGRLRLTTCGKSPAVADPSPFRAGSGPGAGGVHGAARSCSGPTPPELGISRRSPGSSYQDDVTTILATGARQWPAQSVSTGGWAANRVRLPSAGGPNASAAGPPRPGVHCRAGTVLLDGSRTSCLMVHERPA